MDHHGKDAGIFFPSDVLVEALVLKLPGTTLGHFLFHSVANSPCENVRGWLFNYGRTGQKRIRDTIISSTELKWDVSGSKAWTSGCSLGNLERPR